MEQLELLALDKLGPIAIFVLSILGIFAYTVFKIVKLFLEIDR